jgi:organic hydroperoxide reductase OsmC/OhrA
LGQNYIGALDGKNKLMHLYKHCHVINSNNMKTHLYQLTIDWRGNRGNGTLDYSSYDRDFAVQGVGKPEWNCSSDIPFRGRADRYNPEDMLLASLSSCHMLWYLHLCADHGIVVTRYTDSPQATMVQDATGGGKFTEAILRPLVRITQEDQIDLAIALHDLAHERCFIANSLAFEVRIEPNVQWGAQ